MGASTTNREAVAGQRMPPPPSHAHLYGRDLPPRQAEQPLPKQSQGKPTAQVQSLPPQIAALQRSVNSGLAALAQLEQALFRLPLWQKLVSIVPQSDLQQKQMDGLNTVVPNSIRLGLLGAIALVMWWTWPSSQLPPSLAAQLEAMDGRTGNALRSLAIVNAVGGVGNGQGAQPALLQPILLPTPTSASAPVVIVESEPVVAAAPLDDALPDEVDPASLILVPTATAFNVVMPPVVNVVPQVRVLPGVELRRSLTPEPPTPTPTPSPTPVPVNLVAGRLWSTFAPKAAPDNDHYWVGRPFGDYAPNQLASPSYQFGSTAGSRYRIHHGVDISNPFGTPVLAATDGEVVHAGPDDTTLLGPYNNFFGNTVVIRLDRKLPVASGELDVYLLYGHLSQVNVTMGQKVRPEDVIGAVGMTGIAIGPHLHVEIRLGSNTYYNNVNPYLWMTPLEGQGSVAVRVLTADGRTWPGAAISIVRFSGGVAAWARQIITYMDSENIGPDPAWGENGAMDGVPAGSYYVVGMVNGERLSAEITVRAGETSFVELRTKQ